MARPPRERPRCATSGKVRYSTRSQAENSAAGTWSDGQVMEAYECPFCDCWHARTPLWRKQERFDAALALAELERKPQEKASVVR